MAKQSGIGDYLYLGGYDITGDVGSVSRIANPSELLDVTAISSAGYERIHGRYDGAIEFASFFNDATGQEHDVLKAKGSGVNRIATYFKGGAIGNMAAGLVAKQVNYDWTRGQDGSLVSAVQLLGSGYGLDWCQQLTAGKRTDTTATNGSSLDGGASSALGMAAYLQVFDFDGTDITITIEDSANDSSFSAVSGGAFTQITGEPASERIVTSLTATVRRYVRVATSTWGGVSTCTFAVCFTRFPYA